MATAKKSAARGKLRGAVNTTPDRPIVHRSIFADAKVLAAGTPIVVIVPIGCRQRWRIRVKITGTTGTLSAAYVRNKTGNAAYTTNNPSNVALASGVENVMVEDTHRGEALLQVTITPVGAGTLDYCDLMGV